jgi:hypothetical protein
VTEEIETEEPIMAEDALPDGVKAIKAVMLCMGAKLLNALIKEDTEQAKKIDTVYRSLGDIFPKEFDAAQKEIDAGFADLEHPHNPTAIDDPMETTPELGSGTFNGA